MQKLDHNDIANISEMFRLQQQMNVTYSGENWSSTIPREFIRAACDREWGELLAEIESFWRWWKPGFVHGGLVDGEYTVADTYKQSIASMVDLDSEQYKNVMSEVADVLAFNASYILRCTKSCIDDILSSHWVHATLLTIDAEFSDVRPFEGMIRTNAQMSSSVHHASIRAYIAFVWMTCRMFGIDTNTLLVAFKDKHLINERRIDEGYRETGIKSE